MEAFGEQVCKDTETSKESKVFTEEGSIITENHLRLDTILAAYWKDRGLLSRNAMNLRRAPRCTRKS